MRTMRMAALAVIMTLTFSGLGMARDHNDDDDWRHDRHHDRDRDHDRWRDHERHERWEREHRGGWHRDHDRDDWRWRPDRDDGYYNRGGWIWNRGGSGYPGGGYGYPSGGYGYPSGGYYGNNGYNIGYQDGVYQARKDVAEHKPFNPYPRGDSHGTHGYAGYGDINAYRAQYTSGYRSGYESNFRSGYRGWGF